MWANRMLDPLNDFWTLTSLTHDLELIIMVNFKITVSQEWDGQKRCQSIGYRTHYVTLNFDLTHNLGFGFPGEILKVTVFQETPDITLVHGKKKFHLHMLLEGMAGAPVVMLETSMFLHWHFTSHLLTHLPLDKMASISQLTHSNAFSWMKIFIPPATKLVGVYWIHPVCPSVCPLTFRVRPVASTVQGGFFPYLVQMINSMRGCVACDDPWPWPIPSRSFGLDLENHVRSVASTVLDGFFLYFAQMITIIRECVACYIFFKIWKIEFLANFKNFQPWPWKKNLQFSMDSFHI